MRYKYKNANRKRGASKPQNLIVVKETLSVNGGAPRAHHFYSRKFRTKKILQVETFKF